MDDPSTLRRKAAQFFKSAASTAIPDEAEKLNELGRQLELWADEFEEMLARTSRGCDPPEPGKGPLSVNQGDREHASCPLRGFRLIR